MHTISVFCCLRDPELLGPCDDLKHGKQKSHGSNFVCHWQQRGVNAAVSSFQWLCKNYPCFLTNYTATQITPYFWGWLGIGGLQNLDLGLGIGGLQKLDLEYSTIASFAEVTTFGTQWRMRSLPHCVAGQIAILIFDNWTLIWQDLKCNISGQQCRGGRSWISQDHNGHWWNWRGSSLRIVVFIKVSMHFFHFMEKLM